jgi:hypothetical protein
MFAKVADNWGIRCISGFMAPERRGSYSPAVANLNWFLLRVMYVFSPLPAIGGIALAAQDEFAYAAVLLAVALVLFLGGRRTRGQREAPLD